MNPLRAFLTIHRSLRKAQALYRRRHGKEPSHLPGEQPDILEGIDMKNWKTSVLGLLAGLTGTSAVGWTKPDGSVNWISVGLGFALTILGYLAKDHDVTGVPEKK